MMKRLFRVLAWLGKPFAPYQYVMPDGVLFGPDGRTYTDTSEYRPANRAPADNWPALYTDGASGRLHADCGPKRLPAAPAGYHFITGNDDLTGWPYYQLKRDQ